MNAIINKVRKFFRVAAKLPQAVYYLYKKQQYINKQVENVRNMKPTDEQKKKVADELKARL